jgi:4-hydroxybenzoate polyprenyltransferase
MEIVKKRRLSEIMQGFFLLSHPLPVLLHIVAVTIFALLAAWPHILWNVVALVVAAHAAMQLSIAVLNDYCDRRLDAVSRQDKPIARGLVRPQEALIAGVLLAVVMVLLLLPLNPWALGISLLYFTLGQGYNFGLKSTPFSGIVFALAIPLIPLYAFVGVGRIVPIVFWLVPVAALLGIALNLANSLPDIEEDATNNARTLAVVLGVRRSFLACAIFLLLGIVCVALLTVTRTVPAQGWLIGPVLLICILAVCALLFFFGPSRSVARRKLYFYLVVVTCLILAGGWLLAALV